jgi:hypothetical protein
MCLRSAPHGKGLPDDAFSNYKSRFGYILEGLGMENVGIFNGHMEYLTAI